MNIIKLAKKVGVREYEIEHFQKYINSDEWTKGQKRKRLTLFLGMIRMERKCTDEEIINAVNADSDILYELVYSEE